MKFDLLQIGALIALIGGIVISLYDKNIIGVIGWGNALMWFLIAQFRLGRKHE